MKKVTINGSSYDAQFNENLLKVIKRNKIVLENPCSGNGTCGKCKVIIKDKKDESSAISELTIEEKKFLTQEEINKGIRLACFVDIKSDLEVIIPNKSNDKVLSSGFIKEHQIDSNSGYGFAIDIGTTTVAVQLVDLRNGAVLRNKSMINPQKQYGLDVLTRITYVMDNEESGLKELHESIVCGLNDLMRELLLENKVDKEDLVDVTISANTCMLHLLLNTDPKGLGVFPYTPSFIASKELKAKDINLDLGENTKLYTLPGVSAFIGADIVSGVVASDLEERKGTILFIDIGTNGEIVLKHNKKYACCSCAAGPALEGMNISCGVRASSGAIEDVYITPMGNEIKTIDNESPIGICGSGILAVIRELVRNKLINKNGALIKKESIEENDFRQRLIIPNGNKREILLYENPNIIITQSDIRQVQLAKGAILSGFTALLKHFSLTSKDLDEIVIAGQFGAHLPESSLIGSGILPKEAKGKIKYVGNTSLTGAYLTLVSKKERKKCEDISKKMHYLELAVTPSYEDIFRESMFFPVE